MNVRILIATSLVLTACAAQSPDVTAPEVPVSSSSLSSIVSSSKVEQVPAELSVEYFSTMTLSGTDFTLGQPVEKNDAYTRYSIRYVSNGLIISGILNIPTGEGPFPLLVLNHGYIATSVYTNGRGLKREQDYFARHGFAVLHSDYRGHAQSDESPDTRKVYDAGLEYSMDVVNAIQAIRAAGIPSIDTTKIGMLGHSMGGGVTLNILTAFPDLVDAAVLYAPVNADAWENFMRWRDMREEGDRTRDLLGTREENPAAWDALSSLPLLNRITAPVLLFHGTNDKDVPIEWSDDLNGRLIGLDKNMQYVVYRGEGHEFAGRFTDFMQRAAGFFRRELSVNDSTDLYDSKRVLLKPFGLQVSPAESPVSPEKFSGFHTGADFEILPGEDPHAMNVTALCSGEILFAGNAGGYGGVVSQRCMLNGEEVTVVYGHLAPASIIVSVGNTIAAGQVLGNLGKGGTAETDGERAHLHLSIHRGAARELRGYVSSEENLQEWIDPLIADLF